MVRANSKGIGGHQRAYKGKSDTWLTPPEIVKALGHFDLDPCCPPNMPWKTAERMLTPKSNGLTAHWGASRVWLNPPYGPETAKWLEKMAEHASGIALIFARTETDAWHRHVWPHADGILFLKGRIHFHDAKGVRAKFNSGAPSALVAYSLADAYRLRESGIEGHFIAL